jgi:hypothetical protein
MSVFGTMAWVLDRVDIRTQRELRCVLRSYERRLDARLIALYATGPSAPRGLLLEHHGDDAIMPRPFPLISSSVASYETVHGADGDDHEAVVHRIRIGRGLPPLGIVVVDMDAEGPAALNAVEDCADEVEEIVVRAIE